MEGKRQRPLSSYSPTPSNTQPQSVRGRGIPTRLLLHPKQEGSMVGLGHMSCHLYPTSPLGFPPVRCWEAPLRLPHTMPLCLQPHGCFPLLPHHAFCDPNAPPYDDLFPPRYSTICLMNTNPIMPFYNPLSPFLLTVLLPTGY